MRRVLTVLLIACLAVPVFATGVSQTHTAPTLTVLSSADNPFVDGRWGWEVASQQVRRDFPGATIEVLKVDLSDGSSLTLDAMLAAGTAPDVYEDFIGRTAKLITPDFALALDGFVRDVGMYDPQALAPYRRDGKLYALPLPGGAQGFAINLEIMDEIGYTVPDRWTIADFLTMAEMVKRHYNGERWATGMFAANQSGDYLMNNWITAFGANIFAPGDYSEPTIVETGGARVYEFVQFLAHAGYIQPGAATLTDDDYVLQWAEGKLAATAFFEGWTKPYFDTVIASGKRTEPFPYRFVPFPRDPSVENVPSYMSNAVIVVNGSTRYPEVAARWAEYFNNAEQQTQRVLLAGTSSPRRDVTAVHPSPRVAEINAIVAAGGLSDFGQTSEHFGAIRPAHFPVLQAVLNFQMTPEEAVRDYDRRLREALR